MLYQWDVSRQPLGHIFETISGLSKGGEDATVFARRLVEGTVHRLDEIDGLLAEHSERWRVDRMSAVDRNILRLAVFEVMEGRTPKNVVIDEALEVTKRFSSPEAVQFVNGVLDAVCARLTGQTASAARAQEQE
jgi:N utilization substance protein B